MRITKNMILDILVIVNLIRHYREQDYPKTELVCTVTFDDKPYKTLKVITNVINDNGGTKKASDFQIVVYSHFYKNPTRFLGAGEPDGTTVKLYSTGEAFSVKEVFERGDYTYTYSPGCSHNLSAGQYPTGELLCIITINDLYKTTLRIITNVINDNGGTQNANSFSGYIKGSNMANMAGFRGVTIRAGTLVTFYSKDGKYEVVAHSTFYNYRIEYSPAGCSSDTTFEQSAVGIIECTITYDDLYYFDYLVIGDSVVWGQGNRPNDKFHALIEPTIKEKIKNEDISVYRKSIFAHSGAVIGGSNFYSEGGTV